MELNRVDSTKPVQGDKRQFFPYEITFECPECGEDHTRTLHGPGDYIMYPEWGEPAEVEVFCENKNTGEPAKTIEVVPNVTLELNED